MPPSTSMILPPFRRAGVFGSMRCFERTNLDQIGIPDASTRPTDDSNMIRTRHSGLGIDDALRGLGGKSAHEGSQCIVPFACHRRRHRERHRHLVPGEAHRVQLRFASPNASENP